MRKKAIQKLAQLIDSLPKGKERKEVFKDYLELKISNSTEIVLKLIQKYK